MTPLDLIRAGRQQPMRPWPRYLLDAEGWRAMADALRSDPKPALIGLWAGTAHVHALFDVDPSLADPPLPNTPVMVSTPVEAGLYAALSPARPAAALFERMVQDLWGHLAAHGSDARPLLDHGHWPVLQPLSARPVPNGAPPDAPQPPVCGADRYYVSTGPAGGALPGPLKLRVVVDGDAVSGLDCRFGYAHRGILALMRGKPLPAAAQLVARIAADSSVAHSTAFARAAEAALGVEVPARAQALRAITGALERIATHLADLAAALPSLPAARCALLQEELRRTMQAVFGHRFMMDCVLPGGMAADLPPAAADAILRILARISSERSGLARGLGRVAASTIGVADSEGVDARLRRRLTGIQDSVGTVRQALASLPSGPVAASLPATSGEGLGVGHGPRGDVWHWLCLDAGCVTESFACDPAWLAWPSIDAACHGAPLSAMPLILRSFSPSVAGLEL